MELSRPRRAQGVHLATSSFTLGGYAAAEGVAEVAVCHGVYSACLFPVIWNCKCFHHYLCEYVILGHITDKRSLRAKY